MSMDVLRAELERLFSLEELLVLSKEMLGVDPEEIGGTAALASFARALSDHCEASDSLEALCDTLIAARPNIDPTIAAMRLTGADPELDLQPGTSVGDYKVLRKLGEGPQSVCYVAKDGERDIRLKVLRREAMRDRPGMNRFLTLTRLARRLSHPGLPSGTTAGRAGDRYYVAQDLPPGQSLASRIGRSGPIHINEARPLLTGLLEALQEMHRNKMVHGNLKLENVIAFKTPGVDPTVVLQDAFADRLHARKPQNGHIELLSVSSPKTIAPELLRGGTPTFSADIYAFGALLFELLTGKSPFARDTALETAIAHLMDPAAAPSSIAPRGWISPDLDDLVRGLLAKDPDSRPGAVEDVLDKITSIGRPSIHPLLSEEELGERIEALMADPGNEDVALALDTAARDGADPDRIAEAFQIAGDMLVEQSVDPDSDARTGLLYRAARLRQSLGQHELAESLYSQLLEARPREKAARTALESVRRRLGKFDELIETLLEETENGETAVERAEAWGRIGQLYLADLGEPDQALVAFSQALCEAPTRREYVEHLEQLAHTQESWQDVLSTCSEATNSERPAEEKNPLLLQMGKWYTDKYMRPDLALGCYQAVLSTDAANDIAFEGLTSIYRKAQSWAELGKILMQRADAAATPERARDLRAEAAEILETQLGDPGNARPILEGVVRDDPGHERANLILMRIYERAGDYAKMIDLLRAQAPGLPAAEALNIECRIAQIYDDHLGDVGKALNHYQGVLAQDPTHLDALRGLDRLYSKTGQYRELLENLQAQIDLAATPRQKIQLLERVAAVHEEEFLRIADAAMAHEAILDLDETHDASLTALERQYRVLERWHDVVELYDRHVSYIDDSARQVHLLMSRARVLHDQLNAPEGAMETYERVLAIDPENQAALTVLAQLRESAGYADEALLAIDALAERSEDPTERATHYLRAARLLNSRGELDGAIERYQLALDAQPQNREIAADLRTAFVARGDADAAAELVERELEMTDGNAAKARLLSELAYIASRKLHDNTRAERAAKRALDLDPTNARALMVLGDLSFAANHFVEASSYYERVSHRLDSLDKEDTVSTLVRYVDALTQSGSTESALAVMGTLLSLAPNDVEALKRVALVTFEHGDAARAVQMYSDILERFGDNLPSDDTASFTYRLGEARRRTGEIDAAIELLEEAADLDPSAPDPLIALARAYEAKGNWELVVDAKSRSLDVVDDDDRVSLLIEIGELCASKLEDSTRAAKSLVAALEERPDDRNLLLRLMQLYSEEKDWGRLVDVVVKLAEFVSEPSQKAKYYTTAAMVSARELGDPDTALSHYAKAFELDPTATKALEESVALTMEKGDYKSAARMLIKRAERAKQLDNKEALLRTYDALGGLYRERMGMIDEAVSAYEAAQGLDPDNKERSELLASLYATDINRYMGKAIESQTRILRRDPYRADAYKQLRQIYTQTRRADPSWCLCQALYVLRLAEPDEERFFKRMRSEDPAYAQACFEEEDWTGRIIHEDVDPLLSSIFSLIEPAVLSARGQAPEALGFDSSMTIDLAQRPYTFAQTLYYAAGVMGINAPPTFENSNDPGGIGFLHTNPPALTLGMTAMTADVQPQMAAFIAGQHLAYYRPGWYVRQMVASGTGLKSWLFAAIKLISPTFPVTPDLEGPVKELTGALGSFLPTGTKDELARSVSKLLNRPGGLDLKKWVRSVDLTTDRVGFILSHDLENAIRVVQGTEGASSVDAQQRIKELVLYSVSERYFEMRERLGIVIGN